MGKKFQVTSKAIAIGAGLAVVLIGGASAMAATTAAPATMSACWNTTSGALHLKTTKIHCKSGESTATWNVEGVRGLTGLTGATGKTGPAGATGATGAAGADGADGAAGNDGADGLQGDPGPAGDQGPAGDTGPAGPAGPQGDMGYTGPPGVSNVTTVQSADQSVDGATSGTTSAMCPAGDVVLGGGVDSDSLLMMSSHPVVDGAQKGWTATMTNMSDAPHSFTAYAICALVSEMNS